MKIVRYNHKNKLLYPELSLAANIWIILTRNFEVNAHFTFKEDIYFYILRYCRPNETIRLMLEYANVWKMGNENCKIYGK